VPADDEQMQLALALSISEMAKSPQEVDRERELDQRCAQAGLEKRQVFGVRNCLFESVAVLLGGFATKEALRASAVALVRAGRVAPDVIGTVDPVAWCDEMSRNGAWGDNIALQALSELTERPIRVLSSLQREPFAFNPSAAPMANSSPLWLRHIAPAGRAHY